MSHQTRRSRLGLKVLVSTLFVLGTVAGTASTALAAPARPAVIPRALTSSFIAFTGHDFTGTSHDLTGCGGHNIPTPLGSWEVVYQGQHIHTYNVRNEGGASQTTFTSNQSSPNGAGWLSIFIAC